MDHNLLNLEDCTKEKHSQKEKHECYTFSMFLYLYQLLESMVITSSYYLK